MNLNVLRRETGGLPDHYLVVARLRVRKKTGEKERQKIGRDNKVEKLEIEKYKRI